ncbi:MAG: 30S ribosomal protein S20 [Deltaproteobacteria bacterium HGW-Deltaproteobacteria-19]|nr:MAG: 30S ribosomal protein S20 [Deltaproteobacteria bacterium HGW-Deltaproteobacteria-19]
MATHASAIKRSKQSEKRRLRNAMVKSDVKTTIKQVLGAVSGKNMEESQAALKEAIPAIQKAAAKGAFHKKTASRKVSRLTRKVNTLLEK